MEDDIKVSVYCLAYNHEKYIEKTLEGFVNQRTNFNFEVIVHDDFSSDHTTDIIKKYQKRYPNIIKPIFQTENQYTKNIGIVKNFILPLMKGKYVSSCEGDDYWCDENRLQKQYDIMESNQSISFCVHKVKCVNEDGTETGICYPGSNLYSGYIPQKEGIDIICNDFIHISSFFYRRSDFIYYHENKLAFKEASDVGDIPLAMYLISLSDDFYFLSDIMSCYRMGSVGSWNSRQNSNEKHLKHFISMQECLKAYNEFTKFKYTDLCEQGILNEKLRYLIRSSNIRAIIADKALYTNYRRKYSVLFRFKFLLIQLKKYIVGKV